MNIDDMKIGQVKEILTMFGVGLDPFHERAADVASEMIGKKVIIRTYSAGVHFGTIEKNPGARLYCVAHDAYGLGRPRAGSACQQWRFTA